MSTNPQSDADFSFPAMELRILADWEKEQTFQESLRRTEDLPLYVFYDGPPFATGLPHHGHFLASAIKDVIPRYWTMRGYHVRRRFGWDCHGLPIEHEIDKQLGLSAQEALAKLGVAGYNRECRQIVDRYTSQWQESITRFGRWVDFDNDYKTMDVWFMESVWWVFKELWDKGLIYQGHKVMPVSTALTTPLSNFEASSNYKDVQDPAITVLFKLNKEDAYIAAWTTTPWTLPSNLALCVGGDIDYVKVRDAETNKHVYLAESRLAYYEQRFDLEIVTRRKGCELEGLTYQPLFPYFEEERSQGAFVVVTDDYVTVEEGTGVVHQAPAFGEDDLRVAQANQIDTFVCPVSMSGEFTAEVADFAGQFVKDADRDIIKWLKNKDVLWDQATIQHNYPYCYRSETPLIYRAVPSWFVRVTEFRDTLIAANQQVRWVPDHIRDGRFGNWLENATDWAVSRNRVWGTPLPIWINETSGGQICIGSREELRRYTGMSVTDLHREHVDDLEFSIEGEEGTYKRVPQVLDCWFESGSMPYAQLHYPFENRDAFEAGFPANFIAEGLDQTRGWFYTLMVLAAALYGKPAFQNVIVNGMVLAGDGKKMSKSLKNYTDPSTLMSRYGADAFRLYLINSPLMRAEEQNFADSGVELMVRRVLLPWHSALRFLRLYTEIDQWQPDSLDLQSDNVLDRWILSKLQTLKAACTEELDRYRLYSVVPHFLDFIGDLTNWYIRLSRARFWASGVTEDKQFAFSTLYTVVHDFSVLMAPLTPFMAEYAYRQLAGIHKPEGSEESVHFCRYPEVDPKLSNATLERSVSWMQRVVLLGRRKREQDKVNLRTPLSLGVIVHSDQRLLEEIEQLEHYIKVELNLKRVEYDCNEEDHIHLYAKPNFPLLGRRLGKRMGSFHKAIRNLSRDELNQYHEEGELIVDGLLFSGEEIEVLREPKKGSSATTDGRISLALDMELTEDLRLEGLAREIVHRVQATRKNAGFEVTDRISFTYSGSDAVEQALGKFADYARNEILAVNFSAGSPSVYSEEIGKEWVKFDLSRVSTTNGAH